jgi:DNA mismatch repair protein MutS2
MEFDPSSKSPTFRLRPGPPAASEALSLARRLGLPSRWLERAEELLGSEQRDLRRLLRELEGTREAVRERQRELEAEVEDQRKLRRRLEEELAELTVERRTLKKRYRGELELFRREVRERFETEAERLRERLEAGRRRGLAAEATEEVFEAAPEFLLEPEAPAGGEPGDVSVGDRVRHISLGWEGRLEELDGKRALVRVGGKRLRCERHELTRAAGQTEPARRPAARSRVAVHTSEDAGGDELNLVGERVEQALVRLDRWLDRILLEDRRSVRVIHGHGSGRLREAVREHLRGHPAIRSYRPAPRERGGDGATEVELKDG